MARVSDLVVQKKNPNRVNVYLDGEYAFGLSRFVAAWLQPGQELDEAKIGKLIKEDTFEAAYHRALKKLKHRSASRAEIYQKLKEDQVPEEIIRQVLERLENVGLIDDSKFIQEFIENRRTFRPRSRRALAYELRQRGIDPETAQNVVESLDDEELAFQAAKIQAHKYNTLDWPGFRKKTLAFLARRGFSYPSSAEAARRVWTQLHGEPSPDGIESENED